MYLDPHPGKHYCDGCRSLFPDEQLHQIEGKNGNFCVDCMKGFYGKTACVVCGKEIDFIDSIQSERGLTCHRCYSEMYPNGRFYE